MNFILFDIFLVFMVFLVIYDVFKMEKQLNEKQTRTIAFTDLVTLF